ncbi:MAG: hypothetical protein LBG64_00170 [Pseudomonadales bacterium]|nr:hypothetical protein [Pseudomonadales bacterium]
MSKKLFYIAFSIICLVAIITRTLFFNQVPIGTYLDETAILMDVRSVVETGYDVHGLPWYQLIYPSYGDYKAAPYIWLATLSAQVFGINAFAIRLPSLLAGIFTVIVSGLIAKYLYQLFNPKSKDRLIRQKWQLGTMLVTAISPWGIIFSHAAFEGHLAQFLLSLSILILVFTLQKNNLKIWQTVALLLIASFLGGFATWTYFSVRFVWPVIILSILIVYLIVVYRQHLVKSLRRFFGYGILLASIFIFMLLTMLNSPFYEASNQFRLNTDSVLNNPDLSNEVNLQREISGNTFLSRVIFTQTTATITNLAENYSISLGLDFLFVGGDPNLRHGTGMHGLFLLALSPFLFIGLFKLAKNQLPILIILTTWWLIALLPASVPNDVPHALRSLNAFVPLTMIIGYGIVSVFEFKAKLNKFILIGVVVAIFTNLIHFMYYYGVVYRYLSAPYWQANYTLLAEKIVYHKDRFNYVYISDFDGRFFVWHLASADFTPQQRAEREAEISYIFYTAQLTNIKYRRHIILDTANMLFVSTDRSIEYALRTKDPELELVEVFRVENYGEVFLGVTLRNID